VKFLIDANLPRRLARWLASLGHDALHTLELPRGSETEDREIIQVAVSEARIVITRDADFVEAFQIGKGPPGLILIAIGNCTNAELLAHLAKFHDQLFDSANLGLMVELHRELLVISSPGQNT
jgi:predicted nuclease of predicted toxin-antitoxin system